MMMLLETCTDDNNSETEYTECSYFLETFIQSHYHVKHQQSTQELRV